MSQVAQIEYDRMIMQKKKQKQMSQLEDEAHLAKIKSQADAEFYLTQKQAESNKVNEEDWSWAARNLIWCIYIVSLSSCLPFSPTPLA